MEAFFYWIMGLSTLMMVLLGILGYGITQELTRIERRLNNMEALYFKRWAREVAEGEMRE